MFQQTHALPGNIFCLEQLFRSFKGSAAMASLPRDSLVARMLQRGTLPAWNLFDKALVQAGHQNVGTRKG